MARQRYDYIIAGCGLAGLSLAHQMIHSSLADKKVLLIDQSLTPANSKTWSFWHNGKPPFPELIYKSWKQARVAFQDESILQLLEQYEYHSIRSSDFREAIIDELQQHPNFDLKEEAVVSLAGGDSKATLTTASASYHADYIFQSCLTPAKIKADNPHYPLIQHFLGWEIETQKKAFDPSTITLMDFDPGFEGGIAFVYILPESPYRAMLEYTIFSPEIKPPKFYKEKLGIYLHNKYKLRPLDYRMLRTEYGEIPMQDHQFVPWYAPRVLNIGTVGGLTKPSTGYTFSRIQRHADALVKQLSEKGKPALPYRSAFRYRAYDLWLLQIIHDEPAAALHIFRQLFTNNSIDEVFRFLAEENSLLQDIKTMSRVSYSPFFHAMWKTRTRLFQL